MAKLKNKLNLKSLTIGIALGISMSSLIPVFGSVQEYILTRVNYPILVNGTEYVNEELPVLNWEGNTFIPLRAVGDILEAKVEWNEELRRVEIGEVVEVVENTEKITDYLGNEIKYNTLKYEDEGGVIIVDNVKYYRSSTASTILFNKGNSSGWKMENSKYDYTIMKSPMYGLFDLDNSYTIPNEELLLYQNRVYVPANIIDNIKFD